MRKTLFLFVMLLAVFSGTAMAQDLPQTFCGDLAEADCNILEQSAEAMRELNSAAFNFQFDFGMSNIPDFDESINFSLMGDGAYALDQEALSPLMLSPTELMENMDKLPQILEDAIKAISADANFVLTLPQNLPDVETPLPGKVGLSVRMVDGVGYVNLEKLAELDRSGEMPRGWIGLDLAGLVRQAMAQQSDAFQNMPNMDMSMDMMSMFANPEFINRYLTVTRAEDIAVDGQQAATFNMSFDLAGLFSDPAYQEMLLGQIQSMMGSLGSSENLSQSDLDMVMKLYSTLFEGLDFTMSQTIGLEDFYVRQTKMDMAWVLDLNSIGAAFGETSSTKMEPINLNMNFQAGLSQFNNAPEITAPENAQMVPLDDLMGRRS